MNLDALSDLVLAAVVLFLAWRDGPLRPGVALGLGLIGAAALVGVARYSGLEWALGPHRFLSMLGGVLGLPLVAISLRWPQGMIATTFAAASRFALLVGAVGVLLVVGVKLSVWGQVLPAVAALLIAWTAFDDRRIGMLVGAALLLATFAMSVGQFVIPFLNALRQLHYLMALALFLVVSISRKSKVESISTN